MLTKEKKCDFKPFDQVLVRASNLENWNLHLFARVREEEYKYGCGSILVAFGEENAETLRSSNIEGRYIQVNQEPCNTHVDWEQRRYEMAKTMLPITSVSGRGPHGELILETCDKAAELAVIYADALIKELK